MKLFIFITIVLQQVKIILQMAIGLDMMKKERRFGE